MAEKDKGILTASDFIAMYESYADAVEIVLEKDPVKGTECMAHLLHARVLMDINLKMSNIADSLAILTGDDE